MSAISIQYYKAPFGELILGAFEGQLCLADYRYRKQRARVDTRLQRGLNAEYVEAKDPVIDAAIAQLQAYDRGQLERFTVPLKLVGTPFQETVWRALMRVPYGHTITYLGLAQKIGKPTAVRAVANANGANCIAVMVPCHRVIGSNGKLVGYAGGLGAKRRLLMGERNLTLDLG